MKFLFVSTILALAAPSAFGQELKVTLSQNVTFQGKDILATQVLLTFPPGDQGIGPHTHSGPVVGYVIEGELLFQVSCGFRKLTKVILKRQLVKLIHVSGGRTESNYPEGRFSFLRGVWSNSSLGWKRV